MSINVPTSEVICRFLSSSSTIFLQEKKNQNETNILPNLLFDLFKKRIQLQSKSICIHIYLLRYSTKSLKQS